MSYTLNKTDGNTLLTIVDGGFNDDYGIAFFGYNYDGWGEYLNENFVKLLENFAKNEQPDQSVEGQIWYDTSAKLLKLYDGTGYTAIPLFEATASAPTGFSGKFWLDTSDNKLYIHNGSAFKAVTPGTISFSGDATGSGTMDPATGDYAINVTSTVVASNSFNTVAVSAQSSIVADQAGDTLTLVSGSGIVLTTDASTDTITFAADSSTLVLISGTQTISGNKTFSGSLTSTGGFYLGGPTKAIYADLSPSANSAIRWNNSSNYWELSNDGTVYSPIATGSSSPTGASYVTLSTNASLSDERVLTAGSGITITDAGAGSTVTIDNAGVTSITTSSGLSTNTSATGAVSITNTGVTSAVAGTGIGVSGATGAVTITNNGVTSFNGSTGAITNNAFGTVAVSGQSDVVADTGSDTLTLVAGTGITITTNASGDSVTITNTVTDTDLNTTYTVSAQSNASGAALRLTGSDSTTDEVVFVAGSNVTITQTDASTITIAASGGGSGGLSAAYATITDGVNNATASSSDTFKFRGSTGVTTTVTSNDPSHGDNVLISVQDGSTTQKGIVQLSDSSASTSTTLAATANLANTKLAKTGGTLNGALTINDSTASTNTTTGALIVTGGVGVGGAINADSISASGNVTVGGNLTVNGTTTTVNSTTTTLDDPIITLGGDTAPASDDNKDRGIEFRYHNGTAAKVGFFGYDDSSGRFTYIPDATNSSEVFSGAVGDAEFNIVYATANQARYADLAERYEADAFYEPGTVLVVGGEKEVTACTTYGAVNLAGVVSTKPAYLMNSVAGSDVTHPPIALKGRVPCKVYGIVKKGQQLTTSSYAGHAEAVNDQPAGSAIVGIALEDNPGGAAVIEVMIK